MTANNFMERLKYHYKKRQEELKKFEILNEQIEKGLLTLPNQENKGDKARLAKERFN